MVRLFLASAIVLMMSQCQDQTVSGRVMGKEEHVLTEFKGAPPAFTASIAFPEPGRVAGAGPCNRYTGTQNAPYPWVEFGPLASTRMACPDLDAEVEFFAALQSMTNVEVSGPVLLFTNDAGETIEFRYPE